MFGTGQLGGSKVSECDEYHGVDGEGIEKEKTNGILYTVDYFCIQSRQFVR